MIARMHFLAFICWIGCPSAFADQVWQTSAGLGSKHYFVSSGWFFQFPIEGIHSLRFYPGLGARFTYLESTSRTYQTAGIKERNEKPIERVTIKGTKHGALNGAVSIIGEYVPWGMFIGFNIDILGYTFAPQKKSGDASLDGSGINLLRYAYNDFGTLHSEAFVGMNFPKQRIQVRVGTTHSATQYKAKTPIAGISGNRFLNFSDTIFVGFGFLL